MYALKLFRFARTDLGKVGKFMAYATLYATIIILGSGDGALAAIAVTLWLIICIPAAIVFFIVCAFSIYHAVKHGNPMQDYAQEPVNVYHITEKKMLRKQKDWCVICKEFTGCRVNRNPVTGTVVHVIGGGARPTRA